MQHNFQRNLHPHDFHDYVDVPKDAIALCDKDWLCFIHNRCLDPHDSFRWHILANITGVSYYVVSLPDL